MGDRDARSMVGGGVLPAARGEELMTPSARQQAGTPIGGAWLVTGWGVLAMTVRRSGGAAIAQNKRVSQRTACGGEEVGLAQTFGKVFLKVAYTARKREISKKLALYIVCLDKKISVCRDCRLCSGSAHTEVQWP